MQAQTFRIKSSWSFCSHSQVFRGLPEALEASESSSVRFSRFFWEAPEAHWPISGRPVIFGVQGFEGGVWSLSVQKALATAFSRRFGKTTNKIRYQLPNPGRCEHRCSSTPLFTTRIRNASIFTFPSLYSFILGGMRVGLPLPPPLSLSLSLFLLLLRGMRSR